MLGEDRARAELDADAATREGNDGTDTCTMTPLPEPD
jgi:hypothetical protein